MLTRFALVGGTGVLVNLLAVVVMNRLGPEPQLLVGGALAGVGARWYHLYSTAAFVVANLWNFELNRRWTFGSAASSRWWREYLPFVSVGLLGQLLGLGVLTAMMHQGSPLQLPTAVFDSSSGWRTPLYWAQLVTIAVVTPLSFVLNKVWTFSAVRTASRPGPTSPAPGPSGPDLDGAGRA